MVFTAFFAARVLAYVPNAAGQTGQDYAIFLPDLLAGYYWLKTNGIFSIPWMSPAFCGGFPFFADPNEPWFSLPQFLTLFMSPLTAVRVTIVVFAGLGLPGAFWLLRRVFSLSVPAALTGATIFMFNGFYISRMVVGHFTNHTFMLAPAVAACILVPRREGATWRFDLVCAVLAAIGFSLMFEAGMVNVIVPVGFAMVILILLQAWRGGLRISPWLRLAGACGLSIALSATKLVASLFLLAQFPRAQYPIPGIADLVTLIEASIRVIFFQPTLGIRRALVNGSMAIERHEWEYGVTPVALALILAGIFARGGAHPATPRRGLVTLLLAALLPMPMMFNYYQPGWSAFLKSLPLLHSSSLLLRWFTVYVIVAPVAAALGFDRLSAHVRAWGLAAASIAGVLLWVSIYDFGIVYTLPFHPTAIEAAYAKVATAGVPRITTNYMSLTPDGHAIYSPERNDTFTWGMSQIACYQPIFGYFLESFPRSGLRLGPALLANDGQLNLRNPACYIFPEANACQPGDLFPASARAEAEKFLSYRPYEFQLPRAERIAMWTSAIAWLVAITVLLTAMPPRAMYRAFRSRFRSG